MAVQDRDQTGVRSQWLQELCDVRLPTAGVGAPPSGARLSPDGVATSRNRAFW